MASLRTKFRVLILCALVMPSQPLLAAGKFEQGRLTQKLHPQGPSITVVVKPHARGMWYDVEILEKDTLLQTMEVRNGVPVTAKGLRFADLNADGYLDLMLVGGKDFRGEPWYKTWRYHPCANRFLWLGPGADEVKDE